MRKVPGTALANDATGEVVYTPPEGEALIRDLLANWERFLHEEETLDPLVRMAVAHYQFEAIHPFTDGNGRTGRVLNSLFLVEQGLLTLPILYLSRYIIAHKADYYGLLLAVTRDGAWEPWLLYMLRAVEDTAAWTTAKIGAVRKLAADTTEYVRAEAPEDLQPRIGRCYLRAALLPHREPRRSQNRRPPGGVALPQGARCHRRTARADVRQGKALRSSETDDPAHARQQCIPSPTEKGSAVETACDAEFSSKTVLPFANRREHPDRVGDARPEVLVRGLHHRRLAAAQEGIGGALLAERGGQRRACPPRAACGRAPRARRARRCPARPPARTRCWRACIRGRSRPWSHRAARRASASEASICCGVPSNSAPAAAGEQRVAAEKGFCAIIGDMRSRMPGNVEHRERRRRVRECAPCRLRDRVRERGDRLALRPVHRHVRARGARRSGDAADVVRMVVRGEDGDELQPLACEVLEHRLRLAGIDDCGVSARCAASRCSCPCSACSGTISSMDRQSFVSVARSQV